MGSIFLSLSKIVEKEIRDIVIDYRNNLVTSPPFDVLRSSAKAWRGTRVGLCTGRSHHTAAFGADGRRRLNLYISKEASAEGLVVHGLAARQGAQMPYQEDLKQHRSRRKAACF